MARNAATILTLVPREGPVCTAAAMIFALRLLFPARLRLLCHRMREDTRRLVCSCDASPILLAWLPARDDLPPTDKTRPDSGRPTPSVAWSCCVRNLSPST